MQTRIADDAIEPAKIVHCFGDELADGRVIRDIGCREGCAVLPCSRFATLAVHIDQHNLRPLFCKTLDDGCANAVRAAGDDDDLIL